MRRMCLVKLLTVAVLELSAVSACADRTPASPSDRAVVTFSVTGEMFRVSLTSTAQVAAARAAQAGGPARIPTGQIVEGREVNAGWTWHLENVAFAEAAIELCDGRPSDVERQGILFGGGRFCPWSATVVRIE